MPSPDHPYTPTRPLVRQAYVQGSTVPEECPNNGQYCHVRFFLSVLLHSVFAHKDGQQHSAQTAPHCSRSLAIIVDRFVKIARKTRTLELILELARQPAISLEYSTAHV